MATKFIGAGFEVKLKNNYMNNFSKIKFRLAEVSDASNLAKLAKQVFSSTYGAVLSAKTLSTHLEMRFKSKVFEQEILEQQAIFWLATHENDLAGFIKLESTPPPTCVDSNRSIELMKFYVSPEQQSLGIGQSLLEIAVRTLQSEFDTVWLLVWEHNTRAIKFYDKHGFEKIGRQDLMVGETAFHDFVMSRSIV
jgi:diamine N-acetyltransferase